MFNLKQRHVFGHLITCISYQTNTLDSSCVELLLAFKECHFVQNPYITSHVFCCSLTALLKENPVKTHTAGS